MAGATVTAGGGSPTPHGLGSSGHVGSNGAPPNGGSGVVHSWAADSRPPSPLPTGGPDHVSGWRRRCQLRLNGGGYVERKNGVEAIRVKNARRYKDLRHALGEAVSCRLERALCHALRQANMSLLRNDLEQC